MAKQKCGTCRFFQEAGLAGSGWCHHPQRKVSSDVMIMVRRSELACRDDWAKSLWEPIEGGESSEAPFKRPASLGPTVPASLENMRSLLQADTTIAGEVLQGEDVLLSEGRIISEAHEPPVQSVRPASTGGFDPRTAVMRAREAYRERARARDAAARHSAGAEAIAEPFPVEPEPELPTSDDSDTLPITPTPSQDRTLVARSRVLSTAREEERASEERSQEDHVAPSRAMAREQDAREDDLDRSPEREMERFAAAGEFAVQRNGDAPANGTLPAWYRTDLPRICRTCRDFRPSSEGGRGWCANAWAFTHRRLVQEEDAAPCESSIGDWWAPVDDVWLVAADVSSHSRATPLLDRSSGPERGQRRRS